MKSNVLFKNRIVLIIPIDAIFQFSCYIGYMSKCEYNPEKLKALFHYVIWRVGTNAGFGATKLYKIAWFADARQFALTGKSITGSEYIKEEFGPVPTKARQVRSRLVGSGEIREWRDSGLFGAPWRFKALTGPDLSLFSGEELATINYWIRHIDKDHTATSISEESHNYGWEIAKLKEPLPFSAILANRVREPNEAELSWAKERIAELGLS